MYIVEKPPLKQQKKNIYTQKAKIEHWYQKWFLENAKRLKIQLKFIYSEKATKFCEILTLLLTTVHTIKSKVKISQNFVAFSD